jgi:hypothetical protein
VGLIVKNTRESGFRQRRVRYHGFWIYNPTSAEVPRVRGDIQTLSKTIEATYDGAVLRLSESLDILPETGVWVTVDTEEPSSPNAFLTAAKAVKIEGPADWSENLDSYMYADPDKS